MQIHSQNAKIGERKEYEVWFRGTARDNGRACLSIYQSENWPMRCTFVLFVYLNGAMG